MHFFLNLGSGWPLPTQSTGPQPIQLVPNPFNWSPNTVFIWYLSNGPKMAQNSTKWPFMTQNGPSWPKMVLQWSAFMTQNDSSWPKMSLHDSKWPLNISQGHNTWLYATLGHLGDFSEANVAPVGLWKGPRVVHNDTISCSIPMGSVSGPFGVMYGHLGSWRAILVIFWAILVMFWAI